ncbi:MAG: hypothetical protein IKK42_08655, partial [Oscillospiraceae bacterium]|nr:hypothetical protein [Oscillospiraceae bacterium]
DEAIIFYVNNNDTAVVRMCVLKRNSSGWQLVSDFAGNGSGVYSVDFYDLNNDGGDDMLVSWYLFEDKVNKTLTVYSSSRKGNEINFSACATEPYNLLCVADVFSTGEKQLVLTYTDTAKKTDKTHIRLMSLNEQNRVVLVAQTVLDDRISSITSLKSDKPLDSDNTRFFVDALLRDNKLITEILVWNGEKKSFVQLISPSLQYDKLVTARSSNLYSFDIDADETIEIPKREPLSNFQNIDTSSGYMLVWYDYNNGGFFKERNYIVNIRDNYRIYVPDVLDGKLSVKSENNSVWAFLDDSEEKLFTVSVYKSDEFSGNLSQNSVVLLATADKVYVCSTEKKLSDYGINQSDLVKYFSLNS